MPDADNYVKLNPGDVLVMKFDQVTTHTRSVQDPVLKMQKDVTALVFHVSELNGQPANTIFSIISERLKQEFEPYLLGEKFKRYRFTITREAGAFSAPRIVAAAPI